MTYQEDRIIQRLNDYPGQIEHFRTEAGSLNTYWNLENEKLLARQAAFLYAHDTKHTDQAEKLAYIAKMMGGKEARIISADQIPSYLEQIEEQDIQSVCAPLSDGQMLAISLPRDKNYEYLYQREYMFLLNCLKAGLPGYVAALREVPTGLTYNLVRGVWVRGVNVVTLSTCFMAISAIVTAYTGLGFALKRISGSLTPRGKTVCQMLESASHYIGAICMILFSLSLLGVNTGTLVGGVGVTALVFTLGANSLLADVLAGLFITFEGNIMVGDIIIFDDFRGTVTDISIRTTKLKASTTGDVKIISNSQMKVLINQSQVHSTIQIDIPVSCKISLKRAEEIIRGAIREAALKHPQVIHESRYLGAAAQPQWNPFAGAPDPYPVRVAFDCLEPDKVQLTYDLNSELVHWAALLQAAAEEGPEENPEDPADSTAGEKE